jgi:hypothetical protein
MSDGTWAPRPETDSGVCEPWTDQLSKALAAGLPRRTVLKLLVSAASVFGVTAACGPSTPPVNPVPTVDSSPSLKCGGTYCTSQEVCCDGTCCATPPGCGPDGQCKCQVYSNGHLIPGNPCGQGSGQSCCEPGVTCCTHPSTNVGVCCNGPGYTCCTTGEGFACCPPGSGCGANGQCQCLVYNTSGTPVAGLPCGGHHTCCPPELVCCDHAGTSYGQCCESGTTCCATLDGIYSYCCPSGTACCPSSPSMCC